MRDLSLSSAVAAALATIGLALGGSSALAQSGSSPSGSVQGVVTEGSASAAPRSDQPAAAPAKAAGTERKSVKPKTAKAGSDRKSARPTTDRPRTTTPAKDEAAPVPPGGTAPAGVAAAEPAAEPAVQPRPSLVVDGTAAAAAAESSRGPEIEVRVSASQQRENTFRGAVNLLNEGRLDEADQLLRQILAEHPGHDSARQARIGIALKRYRFGEAESLADERLEHGAEHLGFAVVSARLKLDRGEPAAALEVLKRSDAHARSNPDYQALTAAVLQRLSRHAEAAERFRAALALQPASGIWLMGLGVSLQALERSAEAAEAFKRARDSTNLSPELRAFVDQRMTELQR